MSCGVGCRRGSDPELLWLWRRLAATAPIRPLAWEPPYVVGAALEEAKRQKDQKKKSIYNVLSISAAQRSDPVIHIHTFFFSYYLPSCSSTTDWIEFPVLHSRTSLLIHSKWNSLHLLTPNTPFIPTPPLLPLGIHNSALHVCESVSVL